MTNELVQEIKRDLRNMHFKPVENLK